MLDSLNPTLPLNPHLDTNEVLLEDRREAGLYIYSHKNIALLTTPSSSEKSILAHRRLGHLNYRQMKLLSNLSVGLELDSTPTESSTVCVQTKAHKATFSASDHTATRPGELVHTDECAIGIPTINGGHKYYVSFTDDYYLEKCKIQFCQGDLGFTRESIPSSFQLYLY
jgi:hypothetical protein